MRLPASLAGFLTLVCTLVSLTGVCQAQASQTAGEPSSKSASKEPAGKAAAQPVHKEATPKGTSAKHKKSRRTAANWRKRGQQNIDSERAREIQEALIREHYMTGAATGVWDDASQKAMQRYQGDNGWQNKTTPDARALIKLGLGPDRLHLLNPESAMTSTSPPEAPHAAAGAPASPSIPAPANTTAAPSSDPAPGNDQPKK